MKNEFVPYDIALAMKELGFDERCLGYYYNYKGDWRLEYEDASDYGEYDEIVNAPLYQQAFRWFREKYDLKGYPVYRSLLDDSEQWWDWLIIGEEITYKKYNTYEEAQDACLRKLIEIIKEELN